MEEGKNRTRSCGDLRMLIGVLMGVGAASTAAAQTVPTTITIDSSFGRTPGQLGPSATNATVIGNRGATYNVNNLYTLTEAQGRVAGANLFHSFGAFSVGSGDAAVFTTTTPTLQNIIARVSGPSASTIQGLLAVDAVEGSNPNLFLINPAGLTFGAGAIVDVPAAFHVSTANELRFADGVAYQAGVGPDSSMTMAAPEAFGFVGGNANIAFNNVRADGLEGRPAFNAASFDVTAGSVAFDGSALAASGTQIRLLGSGAMANSIPVAIDGAPSAVAQGDVRLTGSSIDTTVFDIGTAGDILLSGRDVVLDDTALTATIDARSRTSATQLGGAGAIRINAAGDVTLLGTSNLQAELLGSFIRNGTPGTIDIVARGDISAAAKPGGAAGPRLSTTGGQSASSISLRSLGGGDIVASNTTIATAGQGTANNRGLATRAAGNIQVETTGNLRLLDSSVSATGVATGTGDISVRANEIVLNGASSISAALLDGPDFTNGGVGSITLDAANRVVIGADASVTARSAGSFQNPSDARPGTLRINAPRIDLDGMITAQSSSSFSPDGTLRRLGEIGGNNIVLDGGSADLTLRGSGAVTSGNPGAAGSAGVINIRGRDVTISGVRLGSGDDAAASGRAGSVQIAAENLLSLSGVRLQSDIAGIGERDLRSAGGFQLNARIIDIDSSQFLSRATAGSSGLPGRFGIRAAESVRIANSTLSIANDANVVDPSFISMQQFGEIRLTAPTITLQNSTLSAESSQNVIASSITLEASPPGNTFNNARVTLENSSLSSSASGTAAAGDIRISVGGIVSLTDSSITSEARGASAGQLVLFGSEVLLNGASRISTSLLGGPAMTAGGVGGIQIFGGTRLFVDANSSIEARAVGSFDNPEQATPSDIVLNAFQLDVDGKITSETLGNVAAGSIMIDTLTSLTLAGSGVLTSSTSGSGNAGNITISAKDDSSGSNFPADVTLSGITITSAAMSGSSGSAGTVAIDATGNLTVANARISSDTAGAGSAGNVTLMARTITVDPSLISSQATNGSSGQTGTIDVMATDAIDLRGSTLSIANAARVTDPAMTALGRIRLAAPRMTLDNTAVTAQSSGNVAASAIAIDAPQGLMIRNSSVTTSAQDGDGGNIDVLASRFLVLDKSQISTSVLGNQIGRGGNITVDANVGVVRDGFIQANTAALGASGGTVVINADQLLPVGRVVTGGNSPLSFDPRLSGLNVIQAAAPDGVSGDIQLSGPVLDIVGTLARVEADFVPSTPLGQDLCRRGNGSSLTQLGRGGLRPLSTGLLRPDTALPLLPELPALSLQRPAQAPANFKCGY